MSKPVPICVVGAGLVGLRHVEVAMDSPLVTLTAVVEPDAAVRARLSQQGLPVVAHISDVGAHTQACVIATPTPTHGTCAEQALSNGWALLVEKPLAGTLDDARAMASAASRAGLPLFTGHHRRCHPFTQAARKAVSQIGDLVAVQGLWSLRKNDDYYIPDWRRAPGSGPLMTNLSHEVDLLRFLMGDITEVTATLSSARRGLPIEDTAALTFRFTDGALGSFVMSDAGASPWSFEAATAENPNIAASGMDYLRFVGTQGATAFPSLTRWGRSGPGEIEWGTPLTREDGPRFERIDPLRAQIDRFASVVDGAQDDILCTAEDGIAATTITLAAALSGRSGQPICPADVPGNYRGD